MTNFLNVDKLNSTVYLSIVTVVKNDPLRLSNTINSLKTYYGNERIEHVIIDAKSSYETLSVIDSIKSHPNVKFLSEHDKGIYYGMNKGTSLASGAYVLYLNCGDEMLIDANKILSLLSNTPEADIVCFNSQLNDGNKVYKLFPNIKAKHKTPTSHQAMIFSKTFLNKNLYDVQYRVASDYDLYLCADSRRIFCLNNIDPITSIQLDGYSSSNPVIAYQEYLLIAFRRLKGVKRVITLIRIAFKALIVIGFKKILPMNHIRFITRFFK
jgi:glycosyltransferase involved in cell wall biosynthesis